MSKITGIEPPDRLPPKVVAMYDAVKTLMEQGYYVSDIRVSAITELAGIGKGTAYEYFDTKEDLIACALAYQVQGMLRTIQTELDRIESFREQISYLLELEEHHQDEKQYLMRFFHMMTDNTEMSGLVGQKLQAYAEATGDTECHPGCPECSPIVMVLRQMIVSGRERGELRQDQPMVYQMYAVAAKLLTYMIYQCGQENQEPVTPDTMHQLVLDGIMGELTNIK